MIGNREEPRSKLESWDDGEDEESEVAPLLEGEGGSGGAMTLATFDVPVQGIFMALTKGRDIAAQVNNILTQEQCAEWLQKCVAFMLEMLANGGWTLTEGKLFLQTLAISGVESEKILNICHCHPSVLWRCPGEAQRNGALAMPSGRSGEGCEGDDAGGGEIPSRMMACVNFPSTMTVYYVDAHRGRRHNTMMACIHRNGASAIMPFNRSSEGFEGDDAGGGGIPSRMISYYVNDRRERNTMMTCVHRSGASAIVPFNRSSEEFEGDDAGGGRIPSRIISYYVNDRPERNTMITAASAMSFDRRGVREIDAGGGGNSSRMMVYVNDRPERHGNFQLGTYSRRFSQMLSVEAHHSIRQMGPLGLIW